MTAALCVIFVFFAAAILRVHLRWRRQLLQQYEKSMNSFMEDASVLIDADETPGSIVDIIEFVSAKATEQKASRQFFLTLLSKRTELSVRPSGPVFQEISEFAEVNPELGHLFSRAATSGLMAMTYNGWFFGTIIRHLVLFDAVYHEDRTRDLATSFRQIGYCVQAA